MIFIDCRKNQRLELKSRPKDKDWLKIIQRHHADVEIYLIFTQFSWWRRLYFHCCCAFRIFLVCYQKTFFFSLPLPFFMSFHLFLFSSTSREYKFPFPIWSEIRPWDTACTTQVLLINASNHWSLFLFFFCMWWKLPLCCVSNCNGFYNKLKVKRAIIWNLSMTWKHIKVKVSLKIYLNLEVFKLSSNE